MCKHKDVAPYCLDCDEFVYPEPSGSWSLEYQPGELRISFALVTAPEKSAERQIKIWEVTLPAEAGSNWQEYFTPGCGPLVDGVTLVVAR